MFLLEETRASKIQRGWSKGKIVFENFVFVRPLGFWVAGNLLARLSALFGCMGREGACSAFVFCLLRKCNPAPAPGIARERTGSV